MLVLLFVNKTDQVMIINIMSLQKKEERKNLLDVDESQYDNRDVCLSPERDTPWVFDGACEEQPYLSTFSSTGPSRSCGFCGNDTAYLRELRDEISAKFKERCKDLVVYGAALGEQYENWPRSKQFLGDHTSKVVNRHGTCFFQFVTDTNGTGDSVSADGSQNLIVIDPARMPYKNNRRNTKVLKFNPGLLFPWADRVIWQDAKLQSAALSYGLPSDYLLHFNRTVQHFGTCSSFMGLPRHDAAVRSAPSVTLKTHCEAIIAAVKTRPTVSDDIDVVRSQCERGEERLSKYIPQESSRSEVFDEAPLVDTAFIVYDMRTPDCRQFNGNLGCSWLDEIHCYSDRDQVSFPVVVANSKLRLSPTLHKGGHEYRDRVHINENDFPMLHVSKRSCHWYYKSFSRCIAPEGEKVAAGDSSNESKDYLSASPPPEEKEETAGFRVAVVVSGTLQRFMIKSSIEHLIKPMIKSTDVTAVDYYVSLTTAKAKAYRSNSGYANHTQPDPILPRSSTHDNIDLEEFVRNTFEKSAKIGALQIQESIDIDSEPMLKARREIAMAKYPNEDPDQRFPMYDNRSPEISKRTVNANRNLLRMHLAIQNLWASAKKWEAEEGFQYDFVLFLKDDSLWLHNFDIMNIAKKEGDIFVPSCDARDPPLDPRELNDHILISRREAADLFGNYYLTLFQTDVRGCMDRLPEALKSFGMRGCNSEMLLKWVTEVESLKVTQVSQSEVPFQRSVNVKLPDGSNMQCFHKFCQSKDLPMQITDEDNKSIGICKNIDWDAIFSPSAS